MKACSQYGLTFPWRNWIYLVEHSCANLLCLPDFSINIVWNEQLRFHGVFLFVVKHSWYCIKLAAFFVLGKVSYLPHPTMESSHQNYWTFCKSWISNKILLADILWNLQRMGLHFRKSTLELFTLDCGLGSQIWAAEFSNIHKRAPASRSPLTPLGTLCAKRFRIHYPDCSVRAKRWAQWLGTNCPIVPLIQELTVTRDDNGIEPWNVMWVGDISCFGYQ